MKKLGRKIFMVDCSSGEWDSYHSWIDSLHETKKDAEERVEKLIADRNKFFVTPCPVGKDPRNMTFDESEVFWDKTYFNLSEKEKKSFDKWDATRDEYDEWHIPKIYCLRIGEIGKR